MTQTVILKTGAARIVPNNLATLLVRSGRATYQTKDMQAAAPTAPAAPAEAVPEPQHEPTIDDLRARAAGLGIDFDGRWGASRLQAAIDAAIEGA